jgi:hypothetical protein
MSFSGLPAKAFLLAAKRSVTAGLLINFAGHAGMVCLADFAHDSSRRAGKPQRDEKGGSLGGKSERCSEV